MSSIHLFPDDFCLPASVIFLNLQTASAHASKTTRTEVPSSIPIIPPTSPIRLWPS